MAVWGSRAVVSGHYDKRRENKPSQTTAPSAASRGPAGARGTHPHITKELSQNISPGAFLTVTVHPAASHRGTSIWSIYGSTGPRLSSTWWVSQMTSEVWSPSSLGRIGAVRFLNSCFILKLTVTSPSSFCGVTLMKTPTLLAFLKAITLQGRKQKNTGSAKFSNNCSERFILTPHKRDAQVYGPWAEYALLEQLPWFVAYSLLFFLQGAHSPSCPTFRTWVLPFMLTAADTSVKQNTPALAMGVMYPAVQQRRATAYSSSCSVRRCRTHSILKAGGSSVTHPTV